MVRIIDTYRDFSTLVFRYQHCAECTDAHGRMTVNLGKQLPVGIHAVKMIVRGDHSFLNMFIAVVPPETRCVVFSIDGSLTGSVSVTGRDPRVRAGAVDVARFWQQNVNAVSL